MPKMITLSQPEPAANGRDPNIAFFAIDDEHREHKLPDQPDDQQFDPQKTAIQCGESPAQSRVDHPTENPQRRSSSRPNAEDSPQRVLIFLGDHILS